MYSTTSPLVSHFTNYCHIITLQIKNPEDVFISIDNAPSNKRLSIERIYQRKTQLEHILIRPDTYVGSVEETTEPMYVFDEEKQAIVKKPVTFVPGLYKIFDEILGELLIYVLSMCCHRTPLCTI